MKSGPRLDRLIPLLTLILAALGLVALIDSSPTQAVFNLGGNLPKIPVAWPLVLLVSVLAGAGAPFLLRGDEQLRRGRPSLPQLGRLTTAALLPFTILPGLAPAAVFAFFRVWRTQWGSGAALATLLVVGSVLPIVYAAQHALVFGRGRGEAGAQTAQSIIANGLAFAIFAGVTFDRSGGPAAPCILFLATVLLSLHLLGDISGTTQQALLVGLLLFAAFLLLQRWPAFFLLQASALLLVFYAATGLLRQATAHGLRRQIIIEYGLILIGGLLLLAVAAVAFSA